MMMVSVSDMAKLKHIYTRSPSSAPGFFASGRHHIAAAKMWQGLFLDVHFPFLTYQDISREQSRRRRAHDQRVAAGIASNFLWGSSVV